jgi:2OG-Fe(II) oxygenase superfamily
MKAINYPGVSHMVGLPAFFSRSECEAWIAKAEGSGEFAPVRQVASRTYAHRKHSRWQKDDAATAQIIFERVRCFVPPMLDSLTPVGCSGNIRLYKYASGESFGPHIDESNDGPEGSQSKFTLLIYLSSVDKADGGRTVFFADHKGKRELASVQPECGFALLHGHGHRCLTHAAEELRGGAVKYVLRTDVLYGKQIIR